MNSVTAQPSSPNLNEMGLMEHLHELRKRLVIAIVAVLLGSIVGYYYSPEIFDLLSTPYLMQKANQMLIGTSPSEAFVVRLKVSLFAGIILTSPVLFLQLWSFIAPGLYQHEKRLVVPFVAVMTGLFLAGAYFCYKVILPLAFQFFVEQYQEIGVQPAITITEHLSTVTSSILAFGAVAELPVLAFFLGRLGIITDRTLIEGGRYAIVIIFVVAAVLTPPDVLSQFLMAGPLIVLYVLSIVVVRFTQPKPLLTADKS